LSMYNDNSDDEMEDAKEEEENEMRRQSKIWQAIRIERRLLIPATRSPETGLLR
jgi:hypothetical protein